MKKSILAGMLITVIFICIPLLAGLIFGSDEDEEEPGPERSPFLKDVYKRQGYGMIYMRNSSTGGTDFIVMSIKKIHPHLTIGKISFAMEAFVIAAGTIAVSRQVENLIYGMIISFIMSTVVDKVMYGLSAGKMALIVTTEPYEVAEKISQTTERGCTFIKAQGSYSEEEREVVMCACSNKQDVYKRQARTANRHR